MIEISLIGAPGAGKSAFAKRIVEASHSEKHPLGIIQDNLPRHFERHLDIAVGQWADARVNMMLFFENMRKEHLARKLFKEEPFIISCFSDIAAMAHARWHLKIFSENDLPRELYLPMERAALGLQVVTHLGALNFKQKQLVYYLPRKDLEDPLDNDFAKDIDEEIRSILQEQIKVPVLKKDMDTNLERVLSDIAKATK